MNINPIEIMAPAGSRESLMAAIQGGAGSIYFGIGKLNMRSNSSQNFTHDDLREIADLCLQNGVKTYITINTVIFDQELTEMHELVDLAADCNVSAIIASDISVMEYARLKGVEVHISTQCNITNLEAVRFYSRYADVMVLARELSLDQVAAIHQGIIGQNICGPSGSLVKLELFIHGAFCMAVSGKCYLSLDNHNSSANRGACLQVCRRPYRVFDDSGEIELSIDNQYIMSPKDLCTIDFLDKIIKAGVSVLKIEGRGRAPEYVKTVTAVYHEAVEAILENNYTPEKTESWKKRLSGVYNRGFWDGYYLGKKMGEWSRKHGSESTIRKVFIGKITNYFSKISVAEIKIETGSLSPGDMVSISGPTSGVVQTTIKEIRLEIESVPIANKGDVCAIVVPEIVRRSDKVYKLISAEE